MKPTFVHCFFEQSGVFRDAFRREGIPAADYDIENAHNETDVVCDLFEEISSAYNGVPSVFDIIEKSDLIVAFFPCTYFCENNVLFFTGQSKCYRNHDIQHILSDVMLRNNKRAEYYNYLLMLFQVCESRGIQLIVENPFSPHHYLINNFPYRPAVIDKNRRARGDYYTKPTMYYFLNRTPTMGESFQMDKPMRYIRAAKPANYSGNGEDERSLISPDYATNFINDYILGKVSKFSQPTLFS